MAKRAQKKVIKNSKKAVHSKKATSKSTQKKVFKVAAKAAPKTSAKKVVQKSGATKINELGHPVQNFSVEATQTGTFTSANLMGKITVLYFYPKDSTPGCTIEGRDFSKLNAEFVKAGAQVLGISRDSMSSHERFSSKECFSFSLLSDPTELLCQQFGVMKEKNMYGKKVWGIERSTFVIDREGKLVQAWRGVKVNGHAAEVLKFVQTL